MLFDQVGKCQREAFVCKVWQRLEEWSGTSAGKNFNDQIWFIEASVCEEGTASGPCAILRNIVNGRTMYDNENLVVGAAAPTWLFEKTKYKWHLVDSTNGGLVDAAGLE